MNTDYLAKDMIDLGFSSIGNIVLQMQLSILLSNGQLSNNNSCSQVNEFGGPTTLYLLLFIKIMPYCISVPVICRIDPVPTVFTP